MNRLTIHIIDLGVSTAAVGLTLLIALQLVTAF
jgi:hypothetical protein